MFIVLSGETPTWRVSNERAFYHGYPKHIFNRISTTLDAFKNDTILHLLLDAT